MEIDLALWLKLTGADKEVKIGDKPDLNLLKKLMKYQMKEVWYQNYDLLIYRAEVDMSPSALLNRLLVERKGGICVEGCALMAFVLQGFKFDFQRVPVFYTVHGQVYQDGALMPHHAIVVFLDGKKYLVEVMFGFNSFREPLEFSFEKTEERTVVPDVEEYRLEVNNNQCHLHLWIKGAWAPQYLIILPIPYNTHAQMIDMYKRFLSTSETFDARDHVLRIGRLTETGRIGFTCPFDSKNLHGSGPYTRVISKNFQPAQSEQIPYEQFRDSIKNIVGLTLNDKHFEQ